MCADLAWLNSQRSISNAWNLAVILPTTLTFRSSQLRNFCSLVQIYRSLLWIRESDWLYYRCLSADRQQLHAWSYTWSFFYMAHHVWTWRNIMKQSFSTHYLALIFLFMQWDYGKFILIQIDHSRSFSTSDSQRSCASLTICSLKTRARCLIVKYSTALFWQKYYSCVCISRESDPEPEPPHFTSHAITATFDFLTTCHGGTSLVSVLCNHKVSVA